MDMPRSRRRTVTILLMAAILITCSTAAVLSMRSGHSTRAMSTFFAGLAFAVLTGLPLSRKTRS